MTATEKNVPHGGSDATIIDRLVTYRIIDTELRVIEASGDNIYYRDRYGLVHGIQIDPDSGYPIPKEPSDDDSSILTKLASEYRQAWKLVNAGVMTWRDVLGPFEADENEPHPSKPPRRLEQVTTG